MIRRLVVMRDWRRWRMFADVESAEDEETVVVETAEDEETGVCRVLEVVQ